MSIFDVAVHSDMHDDMRRNAIALLERMTTVEQQLRNVNVGDALRLARMQGMLDGLTTQVNGIDATLVAQAYCIDALQLKPTETTSTPEHCHIDGCVNPLPPYIIDGCTRDLPVDIDPFCAKCGSPTCKFHTFEHHVPATGDEEEYWQEWCAACEPGICHIETCRNRILQGYRGECTRCGDTTCKDHLTMLGIEVDEDGVDRALFWCDDCIAEINTTAPATTTDDGPSTCYICGIDHDLDDVATCTTCNRTVCFDHSITVRIEKEIYQGERVCKACDYDEYASQCFRITRAFVDYEAKKREIAEEQLYHARTAIENVVRDNASFFTNLYHQQSAHISQVQEQREHARLVATLQAKVIKEQQRQIRFAQSHLTVLDVILSPSTQINVDISESEEE